MRINIWILLALAGILLAACGGGDKSAGNGGSAADEAEARAAADAALLVLGDFPSGWTAAPQDDGNDGGEQLDDFDAEFAECSGIDQDEEFDGVLAEAASPEFSGPDGKSAETDVTVFEDADAAQDALDQLADAFSACDQAFVDLAERAFTEEGERRGEDPSLIDFQVTFKRRATPAVGDSSRVFRMEMRIDAVGYVLYLDFIFVRKGRMGGSLTFSSTMDDAFRQSIVDLFGVRLSQADAALDP